MERHLATNPIFLIVDDFGIEYVGGKHTHHFRQVLQEHYEISKDWKGEKFAGIDLEWNYALPHNDRAFRLFINGFIERILTWFGHKCSIKPQLSPHKYREIHYGSKVQVAPEEVASPSLDTKGIKFVQVIVGGVILYGWAVDKNC